MARRLGYLVELVLVGTILLLPACMSKDVQRKNELNSMVLASMKVFNTHDWEKYATFYTDDFQWDVASSPSRIGRSDFIAALASLPKNDPTFYHYTDRFLASGNFGFLDGCSMVGTNPATGAKYRTFHSDILEFAGLKFKVMSTFSDGAAGSVALGLMEPPLPAPPLPGRRTWPAPEPQPTKLKPGDAQKESMARWNSHEVASMGHMIHQDATILVPPLYDPVGRDGYLAWIEVMFQSFPDLFLEPTRTFDMGDGWVVSEVKMTGTNSGPYLGNVATGTRIELRAAYAGRYDTSGLMTNLRLYIDSMTIMNQLGLKPVAVAAKK